MAKWTTFPQTGEFEFDAARVKKNWGRLHLGDAETCLRKWRYWRRGRCITAVSFKARPWPG